MKYLIDANIVKAVVSGISAKRKVQRSVKSHADYVHPAIHYVRILLIIHVL